MANVAEMKRTDNRNKHRGGYLVRLHKLFEMAILSPTSQESFGKPWTFDA